MSISITPAYSSIFNTLYDEQNPLLPSCYHYSVLRSFEYRDVCNNPVDQPLVHDFAIVWDDDHDKRVIKVAERIYLAGLLSPVQFMGEHKGTLTIILAAKARWELGDIDSYVNSVANAAFKLGDDYWTINIGWFDRHDRDFHTKHQTELNGIIGIDSKREHTHILGIDDRWDIGTKKFDDQGFLKMHASFS